MYNKIVNPITNRKVNINSKFGRKILNNYLYFSYIKKLGGGAPRQIEVDTDQGHKNKVWNLFFEESEENILRSSSFIVDKIHEPSEDKGAIQYLTLKTEDIGKNMCNLLMNLEKEIHEVQSEMLTKDKIKKYDIDDKTIDLGEYTFDTFDNDRLTFIYEKKKDHITVYMHNSIGIESFEERLKKKKYNTMMTYQTGLLKINFTQVHFLLRI